MYPEIGSTHAAKRSPGHQKIDPSDDNMTDDGANTLSHYPLLACMITVPWIKSNVNVVRQADPKSVK